MHPSKEFTYGSLINQFTEADIKAKQLAESVTDNIFRQKPGAEKWSAAECLQHLILFGELYFGSINQKLERVEPAKTSSTTVFKPRVHFRLASGYLEPPYSFKIKTLAPFKPEKSETPDNYKLLKQFSDLQKRFADQVRQCEHQGVNLMDPKIRNPVFSFVKMTFADCYSLITAHQRRHLWQAAQTVRLV